MAWVRLWLCRRQGSAMDSSLVELRDTNHLWIIVPHWSKSTKIRWLTYQIMGQLVVLIVRIIWSWDPKTCKVPQQTITMNTATPLPKARAIVKVKESCARQKAVNSSYQGGILLPAVKQSGHFWEARPENKLLANHPLINIPKRPKLSVATVWRFEIFAKLIKEANMPN